MFQSTTTAPAAGHDTRPRPSAPWQQPGHPSIRVEPAPSTVYPFVLEIGEHDTVRVPMTAAAIGALRDALTALLVHVTPETSQDFVTDWARTHGATVVAAPAPEADEPVTPELPPVYAMAA